MSVPRAAATRIPPNAEDAGIEPARLGFQPSALPTELISEVRGFEPRDP